MNPISQYLEQAMGFAQPYLLLAQDWLTSPAAWSQFALLVVSWLVAGIAAHRITPRLERLIAPRPESKGAFATARRFSCRFWPMASPRSARPLPARSSDRAR